MRILALYIANLIDEQQQEQRNKRDEVVCFLANVSHLPFWERITYTDSLRFAASIVAERMPESGHQIVEQESSGTRIIAKTFHYQGKDTLVILVITDIEYPTRMAWNLIAKANQIHTDEDKATDKVQSRLSTLMHQFQDPQKIDPILRVEQTLDEIKIVMHKNIEEVLRRGENIDHLIDKSEKLKESSKIFLHQAKKQNRCCKSF